MPVDVAELHDFYAKPLGMVVQRLICAHIRRRWPSLRGESLYGLGYAVPYLEVFRDEAAPLGALMPAKQGVMTWPAQGPYQSVLVNENELPLADASVDRVLVVHELEMSFASHSFIREIWRILAPEGRLLLIVPNRRGVWARFDTTPFGHGQPFSRGQLRRLLTQSMFTPLEWDHVLFMPPANHKLLLKSAMAWEKLGSRFWPVFSGVLMVDARKEMYVPAPTASFKLRTSPIVPAPAGFPFSAKDRNSRVKSEKR